MRFEAFGNGVDVFKKNPWLGVGLGDVDVTIQNQFVLNKTKLKLVNRKKPHNQFLENAIQSGIFTPIILLLILLVPLFIKRYRNPLAIAFVVSLVVEGYQSTLGEIAELTHQQVTHSPTKPTDLQQTMH